MRLRLSPAVARFTREKCCARVALGLRLIDLGILAFIRLLVRCVICVLDRRVCYRMPNLLSRSFLVYLGRQSLGHCHLACKCTRHIVCLPKGLRQVVGHDRIVPLLPCTTRILDELRFKFMRQLVRKCHVVCFGQRVLLLRQLFQLRDGQYVAGVGSSGGSGLGFLERDRRGGALFFESRKSLRLWLILHRLLSFLLPICGEVLWNLCLYRA